MAQAAIAKRLGLELPEVPVSPSMDWINDITLARTRSEGSVDEEDGSDIQGHIAMLRKMANAEGFGGGF